MSSLADLDIVFSKSTPLQAFLVGLDYTTRGHTARSYARAISNTLTTPSRCVYLLRL